MGAGGTEKSKSEKLWAQWLGPGKTRSLKNEWTFEVWPHWMDGLGGRRWTGVTAFASDLCICSLLKGGHVFRGGIHTAGPGLEHLRFRHCTLGHHHDLYCDR